MKFLKTIGRFLVVVIACGVLLFTALVALAVWEIALTPALPADYEATAANLDDVLNRMSLDDFADASQGEGSTRLLLITLDTLRADHLSAYGYPRPTSPFLDALAAQGVLFSRAYAPMSSTAPSHATILSGLYPIQHRVLRNGHRMPSEIGTLTEILADAGFTTAGIVSTNRHFLAGNIAQGFAYFNEPTAAELYHQPQGSTPPVDVRYRTADKTLDHALQWLAANHQQERLFLWIHLFDTHLPYIHRSDIADLMRFRDAQERQQWVQFLQQQRHIKWRRQVPLLLPDQTPEYERYDQEVRFIDERLKAFFLQAAPFGIEQFFTVITADHGEGLGDHHYWQHSRNLYNAQLHVPLIVRWPQGTHAGRRIDTVVEHTDIMPTFLWEGRVSKDLIALKRQRPIEGMPLHYLLENHAQSQRFGYAFAQRQQYSQRNILVVIWASVMDKLDTILYGRYAREYEYGEKYALISSHGKYIYREKGWDEFYMLQDDPYEQGNAVQEHNDLKTRLASTLVDLVTYMKKTSPDTLENVDQETIKALKSLGYVQ